jgi:hypothetical protein
MLVSG